MDEKNGEKIHGRIGKERKEEENRTMDSEDDVEGVSRDMCQSVCGGERTEF